MPFILYALTFVTTTGAGAFLSGSNPFASVRGFLSGLPFSLTLMSILTLHEAGHIFAAIRHGIPVALPYFIPAPTLIGTFGAIIRMPPVPHSRKSLFDIGIAGPVAGFFPSLLALIWGLHLSRPVYETGNYGLEIGESFLFHQISLIFGPSLSSGETLVLSPVGFAGWTGLFVTALNLIPAGQLDGGHFLFALWGKKIHRIVWFLVLGVMGWLGMFYWGGWWIWLFFILLMGPGHLPVPDPDNPLGKFRIFLSIFMIFVEFLIFMPSPFINR